MKNYANPLFGKDFRKVGAVKRIAAWVMVLLISVCYAPSLTYADTDSSNEIVYNDAKDSTSSVNYEEILGDAMEYGIVADKYTQNGHTETNFAAKYCYINNPNISPDRSGDGETPFLVGKFDSKQNGFKIDGSTIDGTAIKAFDFYLNETYKDTAKDLVYTDNNSKINFSFLTEDEIDSQITAMQNHVTEQSKALASKTATIQLPSKVIDMNNLTIDATKYADDAVIYVNFPEDSEYNTCSNLNYNINMKKNQLIVFNYAGKDVVIRKVNLNVDGESVAVRDSSYAIQHIIWNMPNATSVQFVDNIGGTFLIPQKDAKVVSGNGGGLLVTGGEITCNGEWHYALTKRKYPNNKTFKVDTKGSINLEGSKTLEGREFTDGDSWTFKLEAVTDGAPMPDNSEVTIKPTSGDSESFRFDTITYKKSDLNGESEATFKYKITESGSVEYVTNDSNTHYVTVTVKDNGTTKLDVTASYDNGDTDTDTSKAVFVNKFKKTEPAIKKVTVSGTKTWDDLDNAGNTRPDKITLNLLQNGEKIDSIDVTPDSDGNWNWSFDPQVKCDDDGNAYTYTVEEVTVDGYTSKVEQTESTDDELTFNVTNKLKATGSVELKGEKQLENRDFQDGDSWTFKLEAVTDGAPMPENTEVTINPTSGNSETFSFGKIDFSRSDLDGAKEKTYKYKITESGSVADVVNDSNAHYVTVTVSFNGSENLKATATYDNGNGEENASKSVFVNTFKKVAPAVKMVTISGTKVWDDDENSENTRPEKITLNLLQNGEKIDSVDVTPDSDGDWTWSFGEQEKYDNDGDEYTYTVEEVAVDGYTSTVEQSDSSDDTLTFTVTKTNDTEKKGT